MKDAVFYDLYKALPRTEKKTFVALFFYKIGSKEIIKEPDMEVNCMKKVKKKLSEF